MSTVYAWSGGKDSAYALSLLRKEDLDLLFTTVNTEHDRVSIHGVRTELLEQQARSLGLDLVKIDLKSVDTVEDYQEKILEFYKNENVEKAVFADIFLEENRAQRESVAEKLNVETSFPIWSEDTDEIAEKFIESGFKAIIVAVNQDYLNKSYVGREYNRKLLKDLKSEGVDPCGENGEFHTFVWDGPIFEEKIDFERGKVIEKDLEPSKYFYMDLKSAS